MSRAFVDRIRVYAKAGDGGRGSASFRRVKLEPLGGPDGGDGGNGGDVVLEVDSHTDNLESFFYRPHLNAKDGQPGASNQKTGRSGGEVVFHVPPGTMIFRSNESFDQTPEYDDDGLPVELEAEDDSEPALELLADLTELGQRFVLAKGGVGGRGNMAFKSSINRSPTEAEPGEEGEKGVFYLEMRHIAQAGFVGMPNAGKSSMLAALSAAKPKIASYPFTTLRPMIGVVRFPGHRRATLADIPGLIEGAHQNIGLGHDFLRHITRCQLLLFVVDAAGSEGRDPVEDLTKLRKELSLYDKSKSLTKRPWMILANKIDLPGAVDNLAMIKQRFPRVRVIPVSAETGEGLDLLRKLLDQKIGRAEWEEVQPA